MARNDDGLYDVCKASLSGEKSAERLFDSLKNDNLKLKIMIQTLYEVMIEQGVNPDLINEKLKEVTDKTLAAAPKLNNVTYCPRCGKAVQEGSKMPLRGRCLYCGQLVTLYPLFETEEKEPAGEEPAPETF